MANYNITIKRSAAKELEDLPRDDLRKIVKRIRSLRINPRPPACQKLSARQLYRIRQEDYRIVYSIDDENLTLDIVKIGHRREVYRS